MLSLLWLVPLLPLIGFLILTLAGARLSRRAMGSIGVGSVGLSMLIVFAVTIAFIASPPPQYAYTQSLWTWIDIGGFHPQIGLYLDALSLIMMLVVTVVGFFIHLYSFEFMIEDEGYRRFFAYMNLFVGSMLILVLADNLLFLYLGWEGVGLCSYLLIGFWYKDPANDTAGRKAFVITRIGDTAFAVGLFLLFTFLGTLDIQEILARAGQQWAVGSYLPIAAAALLLGGAVGKSAQLPLQTWLPDAMAGPTPVSALIHAATMVTAGVYLIARMHTLFTLAPPVQTAVAVIGAVTLLIAGFSALTQYDIKRVLAYSTMSQIGYMFLALGVGAWSAAIFHFMTHAFFKSLLFLAAGVVIMALHEEHNIFKMGGLHRKLPFTFWTFLIGAGSLSALPLITAGFYSKDLILYNVWISQSGGLLLWLAGVLGAVLTALYTFRMVFLVFFGKEQSSPARTPGMAMGIPLGVLAFFSITAGFIEIHIFRGVHILSPFLHTALPALKEVSISSGTRIMLELDAAIAPLIGLVIAYYFFIKKPQYAAALAHSPEGSILHRFWFADWGFDWLYNTLIVRPYNWFARSNRDDAVDLLYRGVEWLSRGLYRIFADTQTGRIKWYAGGIALGAVVALAIVVLS